mgnify:CR=1 FL=1
MAKYVKAMVIIEAEFEVGGLYESGTYGEQIVRHIESSLDIYIKDGTGKVIVKLNPKVHRISGTVERDEKNKTNRRMND